MRIRRISRALVMIVSTLLALIIAVSWTGTAQASAQPPHGQAGPAGQAPSPEQAYQQALRQARQVFEQAYQAAQQAITQAAQDYLNAVGQAANAAERKRADDTFRATISQASKARDAAVQAMGRASRQAEENYLAAIGHPRAPLSLPASALSGKIAEFDRLRRELATAERRVASADQALQTARRQADGQPSTVSRAAGELRAAVRAADAIENKLIGLGQQITAGAQHSSGREQQAADAVTTAWRQLKADQQQESADWLAQLQPAGRPVTTSYMTRVKRIPHLHRHLVRAAASGALDRLYEQPLAHPAQTGSSITTAPVPGTSGGRIARAVHDAVTTPIIAWSRRAFQSLGFQLYKDPARDVYYLLLRHGTDRVEVEELPNAARLNTPKVELPFLPLARIEGVELGVVPELSNNTQEGWRGVKWEKKLNAEGWIAIRLPSLHAPADAPLIVKGGSDRAEPGRLTQQNRISTKTDLLLKLAVRLPGMAKALALPSVIEVKLSAELAHQFPANWSDPRAVLNLMQVSPSLEFVVGGDYSPHALAEGLNQWLETHGIHSPAILDTISSATADLNLSLEAALVIPLGKLPGASIPLHPGQPAIGPTTQASQPAAPDAQCNCFPAGTLVATTHRAVAIQNIRVGDRVWAHNLSNGKTEARTVTALFHRRASELLTMDVSGTLVKVTPDHPFWVPGRGWTPAGQLRAGQNLLRRDGRPARIDTITRQTTSTTVYNFTVAGDDDYYISTAQLLVHNCAMPAPGQPPGSSVGPLAETVNQGASSGAPAQGAYQVYALFDRANTELVTHPDGTKEFRAIGPGPSFLKWGITVHGDLRSRYPNGHIDANIPEYRDISGRLVNSEILVENTPVAMVFVADGLTEPQAKALERTLQSAWGGPANIERYYNDQPVDPRTGKPGQDYPIVSAAKAAGFYDTITGFANWVNAADPVKERGLAWALETLTGLDWAEIKSHLMTDWLLKVHPRAPGTPGGRFVVRFVRDQDQRLHRVVLPGYFGAAGTGANQPEPVKGTEPGELERVIMDRLDHLTGFDPRTRADVTASLSATLNEVRTADPALVTPGQGGLLSDKQVNDILDQVMALRTRDVRNAISAALQHLPGITIFPADAGELARRLASWASDMTGIPAAVAARTARLVAGAIRPEWLSQPGGGGSPVLARTEIMAFWRQLSYPIDAAAWADMALWQLRTALVGPLTAGEPGRFPGVVTELHDMLEHIFTTSSVKPTASAFSPRTVQQLTKQLIAGRGDTIARLLESQLRAKLTERGQSPRADELARIANGLAREARNQPGTTQALASQLSGLAADAIAPADGSVGVRKPRALIDRVMHQVLADRGHLPPGTEPPPTGGLPASRPSPGSPPGAPAGAPAPASEHRTAETGSARASGPEQAPGSTTSARVREPNAAALISWLDQVAARDPVPVHEAALRLGIAPAAVASDSIQALSTEIVAKAEANLGEVAQLAKAAAEPVPGSELASVEAYLKSLRTESDAANLDLASLRKASQPEAMYICKCFPAGTPVATTRGQVPIQDIRVGDRVWAHNLGTGTTEAQRVTELFSRRATEMLTLNVPGGAVQVTPDHPFWVPGRGWVQAGQLKAGDRLLRRDGTVIRIREVTRRQVDTTVYTFTVTDDHDYYVGPAELLVHNCTQPSQFTADQLNRMIDRNNAANKQLADIQARIQAAQQVAAQLSAQQPDSASSYSMAQLDQISARYQAAISTVDDVIARVSAALNKPSATANATPGAGSPGAQDVVSAQIGPPAADQAMVSPGENPIMLPERAASLQAQANTAGGSGQPPQDTTATSAGQPVDGEVRVLPSEQAGPNDIFIDATGGATGSPAPDPLPPQIDLANVPGGGPLATVFNVITLALQANSVRSTIQQQGLQGLNPVPKWQTYSTLQNWVDSWPVRPSDPIADLNRYDPTTTANAADLAGVVHIASNSTQGLNDASLPWSTGDPGVTDSVGSNGEPKYLVAQQLMSSDAAVVAANNPCLAPGNGCTQAQRLTAAQAWQNQVSQATSQVLADAINNYGYDTVSQPTIGQRLGAVGAQLGLPIQGLTDDQAVVAANQLWNNQSQSAQEQAVSLAWKQTHPNDPFPVQTVFVQQPSAWDTITQAASKWLTGAKANLVSNATSAAVSATAIGYTAARDAWQGAVNAWNSTVGRLNQQQAPQNGDNSPVASTDGAPVSGCDGGCRAMVYQPSQASQGQPHDTADQSANGTANADTVAQAEPPVVQQGIQAAQQGAQIAQQAVQSATSTAVQQTQQLAQNVASTVTNDAANAASTVTQDAQNVASTATQDAANATNTVTQDAQDVASAVSSDAQLVEQGQLQQAAAAAQQQAADAAAAAAQQAQQAQQAAAQQAADAAAAAAQQVQQAQQAAAQQAADAAAAAQQQAAAAAATVQQQVADAAAAAQQAATAVTQQATQLAQDAGSALAQAGSAVQQGVQDAGTALGIGG